MPAARLSLVLLAGCVAGCGSDLTLPSDGAPAAIVPIAGDNQRATVGSSLAQPLAVRVTDARGRPVAGAAVRYRIVNGPRVSFSDSAAATDARGEGHVGLKLGSTPGTIVIEAFVIGAGGVELKVRFTITAVGPAPPSGGSNPSSPSTPDSPPTSAPPSSPPPSSSPPSASPPPASPPPSSPSPSGGSGDGNGGDNGNHNGSDNGNGGGHGEHG
jgi:hypothetical protein